MLKTVGIVLLSIIVLVAGILIYSFKKPAVSKNYVKNQVCDGDIEQKYSQYGSFEYKSKVYEAGTENDKLRHYKVWYPTESGTYPLVLMVNGTGVPYPKYEAIFEHLASWGFVVIGNDYETSWDGAAASETLNFALSNKELSSMIDENNIAIGGHSQGGAGTFNAITDFDNSRKYKCAFVLSPTSNPLAVALKWSHHTGEENEYGYDLSKVSIPVFMTAGDGKWDAETISPLEEMKNIFDAIPGNVSVVMARLKNTDHSDVLRKSDGYVTAWLMYHLKNDADAGCAFYSETPELSTNAMWIDFQSR